MLAGKNRMRRLLFAGALGAVCVATFVVFSAFAGAVDIPTQPEGGENPIEELPEPQEPEDDIDFDLPEPEEPREPEEPLLPVQEDPGFDCPECGTEYKLELQEVEEPDNPGDPLDLPEPAEDDENDEPDDEFPIEIPERDEPEGEPVDIVDADEDEAVKPAFQCPGCDGQYEIGLLKIGEPRVPEVPEEDPVEIPEPDDDEFDLDDLLD